MDLRRDLASMKEVAVAFSGGLDSALLLKVASDECERTMGLIGVSDIIAKYEIELAEEIADSIDVPLVKVLVPLMDEEEFLMNDRERCYLCKRLLFETLLKRSRAEGFKRLIDGTNSSDLLDDRPGNRAILELGVDTPLAELNISKSDVRMIAHRLGLGFADRPENTCLATRIPSGYPITLSRLRRIEKAEQYLRSLGISDIRVRDHDGIARVDVPQDQMIIVLGNSNAVSEKLLSLGFDFVTLDLKPLRSGTLD